MAGKYYVIAGNIDQFKQWRHLNYPEMVINGQIQSLQDIVCVSCVDSIRGVSNPSGIFTGTWYKRFDIEQILNQLSVAVSSPEKIASINKACYYIGEMK